MAGRRDLWPVFLVVAACGRTQLEPGDEAPGPDAGQPDAVTQADAADAGAPDVDPSLLFQPCGVIGQGDVRPLAYSPSGDLLAVARGGGWIDLHDPRTGGLLRRLAGQGRTAGSLSFSRDGRLLAEWSSHQRDPIADGGALRLWRMPEGELQLQLSPVSGRLHSGVLSTDGSQVAVLNGSTLEIRRASDGERVRVVEVPGPFVGLALSPDWTQMATVAANFSIQLYDMRSLVRLRQLRQPRSNFDAPAVLAFATGGALLGAWSQQAFELLRVSDGSVIYRAGGASSVAFGADGRTVVSAGPAPSGGALMDILDVESGAQKTIGVPGPAPSVLALAPDGRMVAVGGTDNVLAAWRVSDGAREWRIEPAGHTVPGVRAAMSADSAMLVTAGGEGDARVWQRTIEGLEQVLVLRPEGRVMQVALSRDATTLAALVSRPNVDSYLALWRIRGGALVGSSPSGLGGLAFSADGKRLAGPGPRVGPSGSALIIWDASQATALNVIDPNTFACCDAVAFSPDGSLVAAGSLAGGSGARIFRIADGSLLQTLRPATGRVSSLAFSPDGSLLVVNSDLGRPATFRVADGSPLAEAAEPAAGGWAAGVIGGGRWALTGSGPDLVAWDPLSGALAAMLVGHAGTVLTISVSSDERLMMTSAWDETIRFWCR